MFNIAAWLAVKTWCKKTWAWCKKYWQIFLGAAIPIVLMIIFQKRVELSKVLDRINDDYKKEIDVIENQHAVEIEKREKAQQLYLDTVRKIEEQYKKSASELDANKKKRIKELVEKYQNDPEGLADKISELTGIKRV